MQGISAAVPVVCLTNGIKSCIEKEMLWAMIWRMLLKVRCEMLCHKEHNIDHVLTNIKTWQFLLVTLLIVLYCSTDAIVPNDTGFMGWSRAKRWKNSVVTHHLLIMLNLLQMGITSLGMALCHITRYTVILIMLLFCGIFFTYSFCTSSFRIRLFDLCSLCVKLCPC